MPSLRILVLALAPALALFAIACGEQNPNFCEGPDCTEVDAAVDAPPVTCSTNGPDPSCPAATPVCAAGECTGMCTSDTDCVGRPVAEAVCHTGSGACVTCDENNVQAVPMSTEDDCPSAATAVCDGNTHTCRACTTHSECFSKVCDAGTCAAPANVIYMSANGSDGGNNCDNSASGMGCLTLNFAISKLTATRKYIWMEPSATIYAARNNNDRADFNGSTAHIIGYGATVNRNGAGVVLDIRGTSSVKIEGLAVTNAAGTNGYGIQVDDSRLELYRAIVKDNAFVGVAVTGTSTIRFVRSVIANNDGGGISSMAGEFVLVNNLITANGDANMSAIGGVSLQSSATTNVFEFNTVAANVATTGTADQVICNSATLIARNNIISFSPGQTGRPRISGNCMHTYTLFSPDSATAGTGNMTITDPAMFAFTADFHIGAGSVAAGKANASGLAGETLLDIDGDARTLNGTTVDVGADEIP